MKMRSRSLKSYYICPMSQWCVCATLVQIHQLVQEIECRQGPFFTVFIVWWPWKLGQGHQNLIIFFLVIPMIQYIKFGQNPFFGSRDRVQTIFFFLLLSKLDIESADVTLQMRSRSPESNHFFSHVPMVFLCKFGQNPPIGSGDRVWTRLILFSILWWPWK